MQLIIKPYRSLHCTFEYRNAWRGPDLTGIRILLYAIAFISALFFYPVQDVAAHTVAENTISSKQTTTIPPELGEIIYRINPDSPKQLYIVGICHRDPDTGKNNDYTVSTQIEIYRIGEWLNKHARLNLLLPEGYFAQDHTIQNPASQNAYAPPAAPFLSDSDLEQLLEEESHFINAEMILMDHLNFRAAQVEDRDVYQSCLDCLAKLQRDIKRTAKYEAIVDELNYLQDIRTAILLQNIPETIEKVTTKGAVESHSALFTIGLSHLAKIHQFIEEREIAIKYKKKDFFFSKIENSHLNLVNAQYGITIILPRTLADNTSLLQKTGLDTIPAP